MPDGIDGTIQLPVGGTGKYIDTAELTRPDGTAVERERFSVADHHNVGVGGLARVTNRTLSTFDSAAVDAIQENTRELRAIRLILAAAFGEFGGDVEELEEHGT